MNFALENMKLQDLIDIALQAGNEIMKIYRQDFQVEFKDDKSPLTVADKIANEVICSGLEKLFPNIPLMSEENKQVSYEVRKNWKYYFCIDPIDGTKEFIKKNDEFTVNIALIHDGIPVMGVVVAPALQEIYYAKKGMGAFVASFEASSLFDIKKLPVVRDEKNYVIVASKSHLSKETEEFIANLESEGRERVSVSKGSSLKLCMVADGTADIYPRLAPTMEWDTAAADAIVRESGKMTYDYNDNTAMKYNKKDLLNPWFVVR